MTTPMIDRDDIKHQIEYLQYIIKIDDEYLAMTEAEGSMPDTVRRLKGDLEIRRAEVKRLQSLLTSASLLTQE